MVIYFVHRSISASDRSSVQPTKMLCATFHNQLQYLLQSPVEFQALFMVVKMLKIFILVFMCVNALSISGLLILIIVILISLLHIIIRFKSAGQTWGGAMFLIYPLCGLRYTPQHFSLRVVQLSKHGLVEPNPERSAVRTCRLDTVTCKRTNCVFCHDTRKDTFPSRFSVSNPPTSKVTSCKLQTSSTESHCSNTCPNRKPDNFEMKNAYKNYIRKT